MWDSFLDNRILISQDIENYAVSEREERVTEVALLTRMTGCTGMYWAATGLQLGCNWAVLNCNGVY